MNFEEAVQYINAHTWSQWKLGLGRTQELLRRMGDPQKKLRFVHVAGSNGKGSTCAMLERILRAAGCRTGLYPSPYLVDFRERIQVNGECITEEALCRITEAVAAQADDMEDHPSQFELITAIGMVYFAECACDIVVLEVGMGGTFDSTNVIDAPEAAVITNIGLEHTEYLGNTLAQIAEAKGGIIKTGSPVVCYDSDPEVLEVIGRICREKGCSLKIARKEEITPVSNSLDGQCFKTRGKEYRLALLGEYQLHNAAVVYDVVEVLRGRGFVIPEEAVAEGFAEVRWPARFEVLCRKPLLILDGGHNPQCAQALADSLSVYLPGRKATFVTGILADKNVEEVIRILSPFGDRFICMTPDSPRAMPKEKLAELLRERGKDAEAGPDDMEKALILALKTGDPVVCFGSLYMAGDVLRHYRKACKKVQRAIGLSARRALSDADRAEKSKKICGRLETLPQLAQAETVFSYAALWDEPDLEAFNEWARKHGKNVAFPIIGEDGVMTAAMPGEEEDWTEGPFGIRMPDEARARILSPEEIDVVLIPCTAYDAQGRRCGRGGGYYDRFLSEWEKVHADAEDRMFLIAFTEQETEETVCEPQDIRIPEIIAE